MILLVTNRRDVTTDFVVAELSRRAEPFFRFNTDVADEANLRFELSGTGGQWLLTVEDRTWLAADFRAGYFRRPVLPEAIQHVSPDFVAQVRDEWGATLNSFYSALTCNWLSSPHSIARAEDKPRQLTLAHRLGFRVPETLISSSYRHVADFVPVSPTIAKPVRSGRLTTGESERIAFTSNVFGLTSDDAPAVEASPVIYQREIRKVSDLRVTVVGERVFACEIHQTAHPELDWRKSNPLHLGYKSLKLPEEDAARCVALVQTLDLGFGAIDLVRDSAGNLWFLEINPNGQWAWIEHQTSLPIASAIVDLLIERTAA